MISLQVNGKTVQVDASPDMPLLWVLRDKLGLKGTKYCCGTGLCGVCTVHLDGKAARSCMTPVGEAQTKAITTIEGLSADANYAPLFKAWLDQRVPQCGYCQPGQIMTAAAAIQSGAASSPAEMENIMSGVLCRCGTYPRIRNALRQAVADMKGGKTA